MNLRVKSIFLFPRLRGKVPEADGGAPQAGPLSPFGHLPPLRRGRKNFLGLGSYVLGIGFVVIALVTSSNTFAIDPLPFKDRAEEVRFQNLTKQLRCLVCQNQDLADSDADLAKDLRKQVFEMMQSGKSDAEIKQYLVARYNDFVLYDPPVKPGTWLLWFTPFVLVLIGAFVVAAILRRRGKLLAAEPAAQAEDGDDW
jgi:cytochrome c-type biogenesis protein CcmH